MSRTAFLVAGIVFVLGFFIGSYDLLAAENWAQWRGVRNTGFAENSRPPVSWSEESNIRWKVAIDGSGSSTPIIYGDRVFILTAIDTGIVDPTRAKPEDQPMRVFGIKHPNTEHQFLTICLDRQTGQELWREIAVQKVPHEGHHGDNDFASASPVVHDNKVFVWFGSAGLLTNIFRDNFIPDFLY